MAASPKHLALIVNPSSGRKRSASLLPFIQREFLKQRISVDYFISESEAHLRELAQQLATSAFYTLIGAMGGDSTFAIVINELIKIDNPAPFVMVGAGSSDDIVRHLGIQKIADLCQAIHQKKYQKMDLIRLHDGNNFQFYLAGQANIGLGVTVNRLVGQYFKKKRLSLWRRMVENQLFAGLWAIRQSYQQKLLPVELQVELNSPEAEQSQLIQGNFDIALFSLIRYWATGLDFAPKANIADGLFDLVLIKPKKFISMLRLAHQAKNAYHLSDKSVLYVQANVAKVRSAQPFAVQVDGEILRENNHEKLFHELHVDIVPACLRVLSWRS